MTTTELISILWQLEKGGATKRSREISFVIVNKNGKRWINEPKIEVHGTGDGTCGAELTLRIIPNK